MGPALIEKGKEMGVGKGPLPCRCTWVFFRTLFCFVFFLGSLVHTYLYFKK